MGTAELNKLSFQWSSVYIFLSEGEDSEIPTSDDDDKFIINYWISVRYLQSNFWEYVIWLLTKMVTKTDYSHFIIKETETTYTKKWYWGADSSTTKLVVDKIR